MNFSELEQLMSSRGVNTLAEIARTLNTTPQAVSNWKARNQVPHRISAKLSQLPPAGNPQTSDGPPIYSSPITPYASPIIYEEDTISLPDILITLAGQLKVIVLTTFICVFITFTYIQFVQKPQYISSATVLFPESKTNNISGLAGLASQFGVNVPINDQADLSSASLLPELIKSRTFAEKILAEKFYTDKFGKKLTLLAILTHGDETPDFGYDTLVTNAMGSLDRILEFKKDTKNIFYKITVTGPEPIFTKELAEVALRELEKLNLFYKTQTVNDKLIFIEQRIASVKGDLESSEQALKSFNEKNQQISSPALQLLQERLTREVEIQKGIFLTLKQQHELIKIDQVQKASVFQILDAPQIPLSFSNNYWSWVRGSNWIYKILF